MRCVAPTQGSSPLLSSPHLFYGNGFGKFEEKALAVGAELGVDESLGGVDSDTVVLTERGCLDPPSAGCRFDRERGRHAEGVDRLEGDHTVVCAVIKINSRRLAQQTVAILVQPDQPAAVDRDVEPIVCRKGWPGHELFQLSDDDHRNKTIVRSTQERFIDSTQSREKSMADPSGECISLDRRRIQKPAR